MTSSGFLGEPQTLLKSLIRFDFSLIKHDQVNWEILSNLCGSSLKIFTVQLREYQKDVEYRLHHRLSKDSIFRCKLINEVAICGKIQAYFEYQIKKKQDKKEIGF